MQIISLHFLIMITYLCSSIVSKWIIISFFKLSKTCQHFLKICGKWQKFGTFIFIYIFHASKFATFCFLIHKVGIANFETFCWKYFVEAQTSYFLLLPIHHNILIFFKWSFKKHLEHFKLEVTSTLITISFLISIPENHLESFGCRPRTVSVEGQIWGKKMLKSMRTFGLKTPRYASTLWVRKYKKVQAQKNLLY